MADKKEKVVRFISRYLSLRIITKAGFSREVDGQRSSTAGESIQFEQGVFETSDPEVVKYVEARPEFGKHIQRVPDNVENLTKEQAEQFQSLEAREAAVAAREAALEGKEGQVTANEAGRSEEDEEDEDEGDDLETKTKAELQAIAEEEEVEGTNSRTKVPDLIEAIRAARTDTAAFTD